MFGSIGRIIKFILGGHEDIYALDHAILNVAVPPEHMWMNMGYWKVSTLYFRYLRMD